MAALALLIVAVLVAAVAVPSEAAIRCNTVLNIVRPCGPYVLNRGPLGTCCRGVLGLNAVAKTTADRQAVCNCLKALANSCTDLGKAAGLPKICGLNLPYKISPSTVCRNVR